MAMGLGASEGWRRRLELLWTTAAWLALVGCGATPQLGTEPVKATATDAAVDASVDATADALSGDIRTDATADTDDLGNGSVDGADAAADAPSDDATNGDTDLDSAADAAPTATCGNGALEATEACDDGNIDVDDGCATDCALETAWGATAQADWQALMQGVQNIDFGGALASPFVVWGDGALPLLVDDQGRAVATAARTGAGRVVTVGHEALLQDAASAKDDRAKLLLQAIAWLGAGKAKPKVGVNPSWKATLTYLQQNGVDAVAMSPDKVQGVDVYIAPTFYSFTYTEAQATALVAFRVGGGGLLVAGHAWYWAQTHEEDVATDFSGNWLLEGSGITVTGATSGGKLPQALGQPSPPHHARRAMQALLASVLGKAKLAADETQLAVQSASDAVEVLPLSLSAFFNLVAAWKGQWDNVFGPLIPSPKKPVDVTKNPAALVALRIDDKYAQNLPATQLKPHPAAADFPGAVPGSAAAASLTLTVDATYDGLDGHYGFSGAKAPGWRSTGLYAPAGAAVTVVLDAKAAEAAIAAGVDVLVGAHTDQLWGNKTEFHRHPRVTRRFALQGATTTVGNVFGGPIYVRIPVGSSLGTLKVTFDGAIGMPTWSHGMAPAAWQSERSKPAPWVELHGQRLTLIVPAPAVAKLDDPTALMALWDAVLDAEADLAGLPHARPRNEIFVPDRQISAGYMHSGYPIMTHLDVVPLTLDVAKLKSEGSWGHFHELGHNHQWSSWVIDGSVEVGCNWFSVYVMENVVGMPKGYGHEALAPAAQAAAFASFISKGATAKDWDAFLSLQFDLRLVEAFGWAPLTALQTSYRALKGPDDPKGPQAIVDQWCIRGSKAYGVDLAHTFKVWGHAVSPACAAATAHLSHWPGDPMRQHFAYPPRVRVDPAVGSLAKGTILDPGADPKLGATPAKVALFFGPNDGGGDANVWAGSVEVGAAVAGPVSVDLAGKAAKGSSLKYRWRAVTAAGAFWSDAAGSLGL